MRRCLSCKGVLMQTEKNLPQRLVKEGEQEMQATREFLRSLGLPPGDLNDLPTSPKRFPDGAQYRVEIPASRGRGR